MPLQEDLNSKKQNIVLALQGSFLAVSEWLVTMSRSKKIFLLTMLGLITIGSLIVRYGTAFYLSNKYERQSLVAQPAFLRPEKLTIGQIKIIQNFSGTYSAFTEVVNPNLDLSLERFNYIASFYNSKREVVSRIRGSSFILPNQKKYIFISRIEAIEPLSYGTIEIESEDWQKRLGVPQVKLATPEPIILESLNPLTTVVEGFILNNSPFNLRSSFLAIVLYDHQDQVIALAQREENALTPFERRAYRLQFPGIAKEQVKRVEMQAYTNVLDDTNITVRTDDRQPNNSLDR